MQLIHEVFDQFKYNNISFVENISTGLTSNQNDSIHNLLFLMVPKTDAVGYELMQLASALAIIRSNDGNSGLKTLFEALDIKVGSHLLNRFHLLDHRRLKRSKYIASEQRKLFLKKQRRISSNKKKLLKYGPGYSSGAYSEARKDSDDSEKELEVTSTLCSRPVKNVETEEDFCVLCTGTESNGIVEVEIGLSMENQDIDWIQCSICNAWYNLICLGIDLASGSLPF